ncbi:GNAT family N-acetyltransferase [Microbacterium thalli]|uniref:GNAT family N-acetyltransferase n=1 Tax=Microbacterium thalli TaxID=3027921 RepID=A0ABT5SED6_9MICO|nr:GNAT family N-acetyltransferase [Microbacterium thalli]MDD7928597.1 GNAT family N-acetyltransferase [Microbacterium thalli]MDD7961183.1 GNAT family N-acetyltransferase [Microbacterium thalli]MDN8549397.1 GNAT family N-acetyltransferase [Microbacterium thalli]
MPPVSSARLIDVPAETLYRLLWLRVAVFVVEQRAAYPELDGRDVEPDTELFWVEEDGEVVATLRLLRDSDAARIGRVATAEAARGRGLSAQLMRAAVERAEERWPGIAIDLDAQKHLAPWYARFGFEISGPEFAEDDIPHVPMRRTAA